MMTNRAVGFCFAMKPTAEAKCPGGQRLLSQRAPGIKAMISAEFPVSFRATRFAAEARSGIQS